MILYLGEDYKVNMIDCWIKAHLARQIQKPFVHILSGARQTGKTTLLEEILRSPSLHYNLADPEERTRLLAQPGIFRRECEALPEQSEPHFVLVDEAHAVPAVFDAVQVLYDRKKTRWRFVLCGSSARKLRAAGTNLLPGRSILYRLYPLILPGITLLEEEDRKSVLRFFVTIHLEEEIRREALVKDWGAFVNFLRLAALESGQVVNFAAIFREAGLSQPTIKSYYQLLEDMFIGFRVPAYSKSPRKNLLSTPRFLFFDLGIRHAASGVTPDLNVVRADPGKYFE
jgi:predicted AAA+ superfamily ATPase